MNDIVNLIKLDCYILRTISLGMLLPAVGVAALASVISSNPPLVIGIVLMVSAFSMSSIFTIAEKNNLNKLYGILPVRKKQIIIGRYLFTLLVGILSSTMATILTFFISFVISTKLSNLTFIGWLCGSFFLFCMIISIQFPIYFGYDLSKVSAIANAPVIILFIISSALIKKRPELFNQIISFFIHNQYMIWLIGIVGALFLLGFSMFLSSALYKKRDL
jgi:hypothetical protein